MRPTLLTAGLAGTVLMASTALAQTVTVRGGDTLYSIAGATLGNPLRWPELCAANADVLDGRCDRLIVGMELRIPGAEAAPDPAPVVEEIVEVEETPVAEDVAETEEAPEAEDAPEVEDVPVVEEVPAAPERIVSDVVYDFTALEAEVFSGPAGFVVDHNLPDGPLRLSGNVAGAPSTGRPGVAVILPEDFEQAASGRTVVIEMLARLTRPGEIALAYSTAEVGNSGWQSFELGTAFDRIEMRYDVTELNVGNGDYFGILPDPQETGQVLEISFIAFSAVE